MPDLWKGEWEDREAIGGGGQGDVRLVEHTSTGALGALKKLRDENNTQRRQRLKIEAENLSALDHPHISTLLDRHIPEQGDAFIITEYVNGPTLSNAVTRSDFTLKEAIEISLSLLSALEHAHFIGVIHRDIKPGNIILEDENPSNAVLIDYGLSFNEEQVYSATWTGEQLGNRFLHLPELHRGARDPRSDLAQVVGILLFIMTGEWPVTLRDESGALPHQRPDISNAINDSVQDETVRSRLLNLFDKGFQYRVDDRWQSIDKLKNAINNLEMDAEEDEPPKLKKIGDTLSSRPGFSDNARLDELYHSFMDNSRNVLKKVESGLGIDEVSRKQGGANTSYEENTFRSRFGIGVFEEEVYFLIQGEIVGNQVVMKIPEDDVVICRMQIEDPNWSDYRSELRKIFARRLRDLT